MVDVSQAIDEAKIYVGHCGACGGGMRPLDEDHALAVLAAVPPGGAAAALTALTKALGNAVLMGYCTCQEEPPETVVVPMVGFYLYRLWDENDRLVYLGVSRRLRQRLRTHRKTMGELWVRATWEEYGDATSMLRAEAEAIKAESPAMNQQGV